MKIDGKGILSVLWRIFRFSVNCFVKCVWTYPVFSGIFFVFFLLLLFFPYVLFILILTSPIFAVSAIFIWLRSKSKRRNVVVVEKKENEERPSSPSFSRQKSVRRNVPKKNIEADANGDNIITLTNPLDEILGKNKLSKETLAFEESENEETSDSYHKAKETENVQASVEESAFSGSSEPNVEIMEDEDEEDVQGGNEAAVEWTENDQKNLIDLGNSEVERNMRLESLIARRRARKLIRRDNDHPLLGPIAPIHIGKGNPYNYPRPPHQDEWYTPGSAPPLFGGGNPFDLPYDPHEEKPNLTGGSFDKEFMVTHQKDKDLFYSRHESFCREPLFPFDLKYDPQDPHFDFSFGNEKTTIMERTRNDNGGSDDRMPAVMGTVTDLVQLGSQDRVNTEGLPSEESRCDPNEHEVQTETDSIKDNESLSSSSCEDNGRILARRKFPQVLSVDVQRTNHGAPPKIPHFDKHSFISSPSFDDHTFYKVPSHTPTYSVASDLQVEVSEAGSPRPMGIHDGAYFFADEDSIAYDADIDKDITPNGEGKWGGLFYQELRHEKEPEKLVQNNGANAVHGEDTLKSVKESGNEQDVSETIAPMVGPVESLRHPKLALHQVSDSSSSFLSPRTVLLTPRDQSLHHSSLINSSEGESGSLLIGQRNAKKLSKLGDDSKSITAKHIEGTTDNLTENEAATSSSESQHEKANSDVAADTAEKEGSPAKTDSINRPGKILTDQITYKMDHIVDNNSEIQTPSGGESDKQQSSNSDIKEESNTEPSKPAGESKNSKVTEEPREESVRVSMKEADDSAKNMNKPIVSDNEEDKSTRAESKVHDEQPIEHEDPIKLSKKERVKSDEADALGTSSMEKSTITLDEPGAESKMKHDKLVEHEVPTKLSEKGVKSDEANAPGTSSQEKELVRESIEEANHAVKNIDKPIVSENEEKKSETHLDELRAESKMQPGKPTEHEAPTKPSEKESVKSDEADAPATSSQEKDSPAKIDSTNSTSKVLTDQITSNMNQLVDSKGDSNAQQSSNCKIEEESNNESSKSAGESKNSKVIEELREESISVSTKEADDSAKIMDKPHVSEKEENKTMNPEVESKMQHGKPTEHEADAPGTSSSQEKGSPAKSDSTNNTSKILADQLTSNMNQLVDKDGEFISPRSSNKREIEEEGNNIVPSKSAGESVNSKVTEEIKELINH